MPIAASLPVRIEIYALWSGFASPPQDSGCLVLRREVSGDWTMFDEMSLVQCSVPQERIIRFTNSIDDLATKPEPVRFGRTADELHWHFGGYSTDGSQTILVELHF